MATQALGKAHVPLGEAGSGLYTLATKGCFDVIANATPIVLESAQAKAKACEYGPNCTKGCPVFSIADYGTADGGTSMVLIDQMISAVRTERPEAQIMINYEDQPLNDFKSLFFFVQGMNEASDVRGNVIEPYLKKHKDVFVSCCGTSFHQQCFPDQSIDLGMCFTAMHWLSMLPGPISGGIHHTQATAEQAALFAAQAAQDWEKILLARAHELRDGGRMIIVNFCLGADGSHLGSTSVKHQMYATFAELWGGMVTEGLITQEEFDNTALCMYYRNEAEVRAPFEDPESAVVKAGLTLVSVEEKLTRCPYHQNWVESSGSLDRTEHAHHQVTTMRTWSNSTFLTALSNERPLADREALVEQMFSRFKARVAEAPEDYAMDYVHHYIVLEKKM